MKTVNGQKPGTGTFFLWLWGCVVFIFLLAPVIIIVLVSFEGSSMLSFPPQSYSWRWYVRFLGDPAWQHAGWVSVRVAVLTTLFSTVAGFFAALALVRGSFRGKTTIYALLLTPMIVPTIITAIAFYLTFAKLGATGSILAMALGHTILALPLVMIMLVANFRNLDDSYERAALSLGAGAMYTLWRITLPLLTPSIVSAALFAFLASFDELLISLFLSGVSAQTLTVRIWNSLTLAIEPTIAAVSACLIAVTMVVLSANALLRKSTATQRFD